MTELARPPLRPSAQHAAAERERQGWPLGHRLLAVFAAPLPLARELREHPAWLAPLLISVVAGIVVIVALPDEVLYRGMEGATTRRGELVAITSAPGTVANWERLRLSLGVLATQPLIALIVAGSLSLLFSRLFGGSAGFGRYLAITTHAFLISAAGALAALPIQIAAADSALRPSLALLVPQLSTLGALGAALSWINPFTVWTVVVLAIGVAGINGYRSARLPLLVLLGLYLAVALPLALITR